MKNYCAFIKKKKESDPSTPIKHMQGWVSDKRWEMYKPLQEDETQEEIEFKEAL
jgi:hypothetical protein